MSSIDQICIVMELAQTDVEKMFRFPIEFNQHHLIKVFYGCISSMAFLHQANVIHRDLKTANILIESNCAVKLCDFGLSRSMPPSFQQVKNFQTQKIRNLVADKIPVSMKSKEKAKLMNQ